MTSKERHDARYARRKAARMEKRKRDQQTVGDISSALSYSAMYEAGKAACKGVRWKTSTKNFEMRLFSRTARARKKLIDRKWRCRRSCTFYLVERGHQRKIDAPHIDDRQVHKAVCRQVLRPLYYPHLIYDNGASIESKGFSFSVDRVVTFLRWWYRRYGREGYAVLTDFKGYFPNAPHNTIEDIHKKYISDDGLRDLCDYLLNAFSTVGMALGVETSQTEAGILPNALDHFLKDQQGVKCLERYMDDTLFLTRTLAEADAALSTIRVICAENGLTLNEAKLHKKPLTGWFTYCQWRYYLTDTGEIIKKPSRRSITTMQRKLNSFHRLYRAGDMTLFQVQEAYKCWKSYVKQGNSHNVVLNMDRKFHRLFEFYPT